MIPAGFIIAIKPPDEDVVFSKAATEQNRKDVLESLDWFERTDAREEKA